MCSMIVGYSDNTMAGESKEKILMECLREYLPEFIGYYFETIYHKLNTGKNCYISIESAIPPLSKERSTKFPLVYSYYRNILYATLLHKYFEKEFFINPHLLGKFPLRYVYITRDNNIKPFDDFEDHNTMFTLDSCGKKIKSIKIENLLENIRKWFLGIYMPRFFGPADPRRYSIDLYGYGSTELSKITNNKSIISIFEDISKSFYNYKFMLKSLSYQINLYYLITKNERLLTYPVLVFYAHYTSSRKAFEEVLNFCFELDIDDLRDSSKAFKNKLEKMIESFLMTSLITSTSNSEQNNV